MPPTKRSKKTNKPKLLTLSDKLTEILIYFIVVFSAWAFGTTETWSIWVMNISAYALGILLIIKWILKKSAMDDVITISNRATNNYEFSKLSLANNVCGTLLKINICILLVYIFISAINARADFNINTGEYKYFEKFNEFLPHSYDASATWEVLWKYLTLAIFYFAVKEWIKSSTLTAKNRKQDVHRRNKLLYLICINAGIFALFGILQRLYYDGSSGKILFLIEPKINVNNTLQFSSFAYRGNAATYLNLIWPLGIWLIFNKMKEYKGKIIGARSEIILIPFIILCFSASILTYSRGGIIITIFNVICIFLILNSTKYLPNIYKLLVNVSFVITAIISFHYGGYEITKRFNYLKEGIDGRLMIANKTLNLIQDYNIFGSGPGSFETISQFEIEDGMAQWESWAHNDYLEFYLTFGFPGFLIMIFVIVTLFLLFIFNTLFIDYNAINIILLVPFLGILINSVFDFPLQVQSINLLIITMLASFSCKNLCSFKEKQFI